MRAHHGRKARRECNCVRAESVPTWPSYRSKASICIGNNCALSSALYPALVPCNSCYLSLLPLLCGASLGWAMLGAQDSAPARWKDENAPPGGDSRRQAPAPTDHLTRGEPYGHWQPELAGTCSHLPAGDEATLQSRHWGRRALTVRLADTPAASTSAQAPVSCPSRLQFSPTRAGAFDPFAPQTDNDLPGCTPMCAQLAAAPPAPPAVHRKALAAQGSPARPAAATLADRVQSCPPERAGRQSTRPLLRVRHVGTLHRLGLDLSYQQCEHGHETVGFQMPSHVTCWCDPAQHA